MNDILSKIANNLKNEDVDEIAINDILQKVKTYWNYIGIIDWDNIGYIEILRELSMAKFLKAKFNDETKFSIMQKTLVYRDDESCIFKPTDFKESSIIGEPICCFAYSQERWNEHYIAYQEAIYYVYDVIRDGNLGDFVAITIRPNGRALVLDKEHNWWSPSDSIRYINGLGDGSSVFKTKEGKSIKTENKQHKTNKTMKQIKTLTESKLRGIIREAVKRVLSESDAEYNDFMEKANNMERSDRFAFIMENTDNEQLLWVMWHWFENENNGKDMDDFMQYCLKQFAPKQDYWTQIRNIYNSPIMASYD